jgi:L-lysine 2,3-aminomutase
MFIKVLFPFSDLDDIIITIQKIDDDKQKRLKSHKKVIFPSKLIDNYLVLIKKVYIIIFFVFD